MKVNKLIQWSPHNSTKFVVGSTDLRLYEASSSTQEERNKTEKKQDSSEIQFSVEVPTDETISRGSREKKNITLLSANYEVQWIKCLSWCPAVESSGNGIVAVGLPSGKVLLTIFSSSTCTNRIAKEFVPKHSRSCNALAWNPKYPNQLAAGLDKVRGDFSTIVWDVSLLGTDYSLHHSDKLDQTSSDRSFTLNGMDSTETIVKPFAELANSEATIALAWLPSSPSCLVTGTGVKWMRIYDLRGDLNAPQSVVAHSKSVHGVCFNPFNDEQLATYSEDGIIKLWDIRNFIEPTFFFNSNSKGLVQIEWCPTRSGILASISKEEKYIKLWDIKDTIIAQKNEKNSDSTPITKPCRTVETPEALFSFSWHPRSEYRMITVGYSGLIEDIRLRDPIPLGWSAQDSLLFGYGKKLVEANIIGAAETTFAINDISFEMKNRTLLGYSTDVTVNKKLCDSFGWNKLKVIWDWMFGYACGGFSFLGNKEGFPATVELFQGIQNILAQMTGTSKKIETSFEQKSLLFPVYNSPQRSICLQICGWGFEKKEVLEQYLLKLESDGEFERAASIAVFHLDLRRAIVSLTRGAKSMSNGHDVNLKLVAMALAGCSDSDAKSGLWKDTCLDPSILSEMKHPYLRVCFSFLCNESKEFKSVLDDSDISFYDKVAFACRFLDDEDLKKFIDRLIESLTEKGYLEGITLTGLNQHGVNLLERYVNNTGDVQTAVLITTHVVPKKFKDPRVERWVKVYRELLDTWQLWHQRARFDMVRRDPPPTQVYVRCNFCNQPLSMGQILTKRPRTTRGIGNTKQTVQKHKTSSCPSCKKPLPRCSLCLLSFNANIPNVGVKQSAISTASPFEDWFTWCQTCRHGGHASHMMDWFKQNDHCPVTDCNCKCSSL